MQRNSEATGIGRRENGCMVTNSIRCRQLLGLGNNQGTGELESHYWAWPGLEEVLPGTDEEDGQSAGACLAGSSGSFRRCKPSFDINCPKAKKKKKGTILIHLASEFRCPPNFVASPQFRGLKSSEKNWTIVARVISSNFVGHSSPLWEANLKQTVSRHRASLTRSWCPLTLPPKVTAIYLGRV